MSIRTALYFFNTCKFSEKPQLTLYSYINHSSGLLQYNKLPFSNIQFYLDTEHTLYNFFLLPYFAPMRLCFHIYRFFLTQILLQMASSTTNQYYLSTMHFFFPVNRLFFTQYSMVLVCLQ